MSRRVGCNSWLLRLEICALLFSLATLYAACTAPNPDYPEAESCTAGQRQCAKSGASASRPRAQVCGRDQNDEFVLIDELCPTGTLCDAGHCTPSPSATACSRQSDCPANFSCVPLVKGGVLASFCVQSQSAAAAPGDACNKDENCQSYHCLQQAGGRYCLFACGSDNHCPLATPRCQALNVTITGVQGMVGSCSPR